MSGISQTNSEPSDDTQGDGERVADAEMAEWGADDGADDGERQEQGGSDDDASALSALAAEEGAGGEDDAPPEFWSAERKALWAKVTDPELKAAIRGHVEDVSKGTAKKLEEHALKVRQAEESARAATENQDQLANWWKANGQRIQLAVLGKWASVDWQKLSVDDPAGYVQAKQQLESEQQFVRDVTQRHQVEVKKAEQRQEQAHQRERAAEHAKLAEKYPNEFGPEKAQETYTTLSDYLLRQGIAAERLKGIYEAPVVEIVRKAHKYDQLMAKAKGLTNPKLPDASASTTPRRVAPGPGQRSGNQASAAERQALERLRKGEPLTDEDAGLAFR
jgi:hypothetical protein